MGREFIELFNEWAESYDHTVHGHVDKEYEDVFEHYEAILHTVADRVAGNIIEFGVGTGNLSAILLDRGNTVIGVEPSQMMRAKASQKRKDLTLLDGDFLNLDWPTDIEIHGIVSTYAFHHLTDTEKKEAIKLYHKKLANNGKIVFADTIFSSEETRKEIIDIYEKKRYTNLVDNLRTEYYATKSDMEDIFISQNFQIEFKQLNTFVWLMEATKNKSTNSPTDDSA